VHLKSSAKSTTIKYKQQNFWSKVKNRLPPKNKKTTYRYRIACFWRCQIYFI